MSGPLPDLLSPLGVPVSWLYERIVETRNRRYDRGAGVQQLPVPVISVGNITTGGTGKTPMVMWIARFLRERGLHPAVTTRGYGGTMTKPADEAVEYAERLPAVPLIVNPDRLAASRAHLAANPDTDCIILDDGFQHRRVRRDLDLVLIDAAADTFGGRMIPAGHLREPLRNLERADGVIVTRASGWAGDGPDEPMSQLSENIRRHHGRLPIAWTRHVWTGLRLHEPSSPHEAEGRTVAPGWLRGKRVVTLLGVGNPRSIIAQLEAAGASVVADVPAGDHERFSPAKLEVARGLCDGSLGDGGLFVTQKDWVRVRDVIDLRRWPVPIVVPQLEIEFLNGRDSLEHLILTAARSQARAPASDA